MFSCEGPVRTVKGVTVVRDHADGANRVEKWQRDLALLTEALKADASSAHNWRYLGESYRALGEPAAAAAAFVNAAMLTPVAEERYLALTAAGEQRVAAGDVEGGVSLLLTADEERPSRQEALLSLARILNRDGQYARCVDVLRRRQLSEVPPRDDVSGIYLPAYATELRHELEAAERGR